MRVVTISAPGGPEKLELTTLPEPRLGSADVLIDVAAAGVNRADALQRAGAYPPPPGAPAWPGLEVSGVISAVGPDVAGLPGAPAVGDPVVALLDGGGYAERVAVRAAQVLALPDGVDLAAAGGLPEAVCTAWSNLVDVARLAPGERLLIHGGSGGVGTIAIQLAKALGARVAATAGGPERVARCVALGADLGVDHVGQDFVEVVRSAWGGVDVILDVIGAAYLDRNLRALDTGGRLVVIGTQRGARGEVNLGRLMAKRALVAGTTLRSRPPADKARIVREVGHEVWPMIAVGQIKPVIHAELPLAAARRAHELLDSGEVFGKLLLVP